MRNVSGDPYLSARVRFVSLATLPIVEQLRLVGTSVAFAVCEPEPPELPPSRECPCQPSYVCAPCSSRSSPSLLYLLPTVSL